MAFNLGLGAFISVYLSPVLSLNFVSIVLLCCHDRLRHQK